MFFHKSRDREKSMNEIKDVMNSDLERMVEEAPPEHETGGAPLFVKVEKYRDIIKSVQEMKLFVSSTKQVFSVLQEIESLRVDTLNVLRATVQRIERSIVEVDSELLRPYGASVAEVEESTDVNHIESSLTELQKQLNDLKRELQEMR